MEAEIVHLDTYRKVKVRQKKSSTDQAIPIFSWKDDYQVRLLTRSALVRACVVEALEKLNVNTADPVRVTRGRRVDITVDERRMRAENLSAEDLLFNIQSIIQKITSHTPDPSFIRPQSTDESPYVSIYIP